MCNELEKDDIYTFITNYLEISNVLMATVYSQDVLDKDNCKKLQGCCKELAAEQNSLVSLLLVLSVINCCNSCILANCNLLISLY